MLHSLCMFDLRSLLKFAKTLLEVTCVVVKSVSKAMHVFSAMMSMNVQLAVIYVHWMLIVATLTAVMNVDVLMVILVMVSHVKILMSV